MDLSGRGPGATAVAKLLDAAEAAPPVEAVEAVTRELGEALGAAAVSFLIADMSGRAVVRLVHVEVLTSDGLATTTTTRGSPGGSVGTGRSPPR